MSWAYYLNIFDKTFIHVYCNMYNVIIILVLKPKYHYTCIGNRSYIYALINSKFKWKLSMDLLKFKNDMYLILGTMIFILNSPIVSVNR